jgi:serine/threonine protein kinase
MNSTKSGYLIKFYHHPSNSVNIPLQEANLKASNSLLRPKQFALKIFDVQLKEGEHFLSMLTESYSVSLKEHLKLRGVCFYFDLLKFLVQAAKLVKELDQRGILLMHLGQEQLVYDNDGNLLLANLDFCAETLLKKQNKKGFLNIFFQRFQQTQSMHLLAPEVRANNNFSVKSLIWDIGMLGYQLLTGRTPVGLSSIKELGNIKLDFEDVKEFNKVNESLQLIIGNCLVKDPVNRLTPDELIASVMKATENELPKILRDSEGYFIMRMLKTEHPDFIPEISQFSNFILPEEWKREKIINGFMPKNKVIHSKNLRLHKQVEILLNEKENVHNAMLKKLVKEAWENPSSVIRFYDFLVNGLGSILSKKILGMKALVVLHYFIFYGSQNSLVIYMKDQAKRNTVLIFLESILAHHSDRPASLLFRYSYFLYMKVNLHIRMSNYLENNFSIPKTKFIMQYGSVLSPNNMKMILEFIKFTYTFLLSERKYFFDYYYRLFIIGIFNELISAMGLVANVVVFLRFVLLLFRGDPKHMVKEEYRSISNSLKNILKYLSKIIKGANAYIVQAKFLGFNDLIVFKQTDDIMQLYQDLTPKISKAQENPKNISPQGFTKNFMNYLLKMNTALGIEEFTGKSSIISKASEFRRGVLPILKKYVPMEDTFSTLDSDVLDMLPLSKKWYMEYGQTVSSFKDLSILRAKGVPVMSSASMQSTMRLRSTINKTSVASSQRKPVSTLLNAPTSIVRNNKDLSPISEKKKKPVAIRKPMKNQKNKSTQTDPIVETVYDPTWMVSLEDKIQERNKIQEKIKKIGEIKDVPEEGKLQFYKDPDTNDIKLYNQNITYFMETEFEKSIEQWIVEYGDLEFNELMASGSTCKVYHGYYRNLEVAIKKLNTPNPTKKFRYLKEFKRELGVLISMPKHPNVVALYGFCVYKEEIYLVFEYCTGQTLFDILYRKETRFRMNLKQKLKVLMDIARSIQYLHELRPQMIHRDLKTLNILLDKKVAKNSLDFTAKISDFGLTRLFEANEEFLTKRMGTFHWMSPEVFNGRPYSTKSDMYGFAIIMWEIFSEKTPYYQLDDPSQVIKFVFYKAGRPSLDDCKIPSEYSQRIKKLIQRNWDDKPAIRQEFSELYQDLFAIFQEL